MGCSGLLTGSNASSDSTIMAGSFLTSAIQDLVFLHDSLNQLTTQDELGEIVDSMEILNGTYFIDNLLSFPANYVIKLKSLDTNAVFIFNISNKLVIGNGVRFVLDGAKASNIFWNANLEVEISNNVIAYGTFISATNVQLGANVSGCMSVLAINNLEINANNGLFSNASKSLSIISNNTICVNTCPNFNLVNDGSFSACNPANFTTNLAQWPGEIQIRAGQFVLVQNTSQINNNNNGNWALAEHTGNNGCFFSR